MKKKFIIGFILLILLSTYTPGSIKFLRNFSIQTIEIKNNSIVKKDYLEKKLFFLYNKNLFFLKSSEIKETLQNIDFIESFELKKIYPNKIIINIFEKKPIAILQNKKKKFYISEKLNKINYSNLEEFKKLPTVFGNEKEFKILYNNLKKINFPSKEITRYFLFETKRWDLEISNKTTIKLPPNNYLKKLENFMDLYKDPNYKKYKIFDYRINNQLILK